MKKMNNNYNLLHLINNCCIYGNNKNDFANFDLYVKTMDNTKVMLGRLTLLKIDWCLECLDLYCKKRKFYLEYIMGKKYGWGDVDKNWHSHLKLTIEQDIRYL